MSENPVLEPFTIDGDAYTVSWLAREQFSRGWEERWAMEGNCPVVALSNGVGIRRVGQTAVSTLWYRQPLPQEALVRIRAAVVEPAPENAGNLNLFLHANEADGSRLHLDRDGAYAAYHGIPNYLVTLTGGYTPGYSRFRRNPGFALISEDTSVRADVGKSYDIVITVQAGRVRYYVNGRRIHDFLDASPLPAGSFGLRTWSSHVDWREVQFARLRAPGSPTTAPVA
jgi:hypothetical protein